MNELLNERLSQLMDGETEDVDGRIIGDLINTPAARDTWWRYHLIGDILKRETVLLAHRDLAQRISAALDTEPAVLIPKTLLRRRDWSTPLAGLAIAASVAVIAILGIQHKAEELPGNPAVMPQTVARLAPQLPEITAQSIQELSPIATPIVRQFNPPAKLASIETREQGIVTAASPVYSHINSYLLNYNEYRTTETRMQGMLPYVRIIAHETDY
jgi:sigma-E factor negative regulatory protein RseA